MKQFLLTQPTWLSVLICSLILWSCSHDEPMVIDQQESSTEFSYNKRSVEDIMNIAVNYANIASEQQSRSSKLKVDNNSLTPITFSHGRQSSDTLLYAVDFEDNNGFLIISANKLTEPILAIIDTGKFNDSEDVENEGFKYFMEAAEEYVSNTIAGIEPNPGVESPRLVFYNDTLTITKMPEYRLEVLWGQGWPENQYCPNKIAGCVPVAAAQVLSYFKPSLNMNLTFVEKPKDSVIINWNELCNHTNSISSYYPSQSTIDNHYSDCNANSDAHDMLALMIRQLGVEASAIYNTSSTEAYTFLVINYIKNILPNNNYVNINGSKFYDAIAGGGIALVEGFTAGDEGHAWVIDGTYRIEYRITTYYNYSPTTGEYDSKTTRTETTNYVHCNWGWNGVQNGFFLDGIYDTAKGIDPWGSTGSRYNFEYYISGTVFK